LKQISYFIKADGFLLEFFKEEATVVVNTSPGAESDHTEPTFWSVSNQSAAPMNQPRQGTKFFASFA
jgi:hypothetical protein